MNERVRAVLAEAAMRGVRQVRGAFYDRDGGASALGVLHMAIPGHEPLDSMECSGCLGGSQNLFDAVIREYELSDNEMKETADLNDSGIDFLGIAYRVGLRTEVMS